MGKQPKMYALSADVVNYGCAKGCLALVCKSLKLMHERTFDSREIHSTAIIVVGKKLQDGL